MFGLDIRASTRLRPAFRLLLDGGIFYFITKRHILSNYQMLENILQ